MTRSRRWTVLLLSLAVTLALAPAVRATNGMYLVGYGAEAIGRAGANIGDLRS